MQVTTTIELPANAPAGMLLAYAANTDVLIDAYGKTTKFGKAMAAQQAELRKLADATVADDNATRAETPHADQPAQANTSDKTGVRKIKVWPKNEDGTFQEANGTYEETFTFGSVTLYMYRNLDKERYDVFTAKGYPLSHSAKSVEAARYGAREQVKKIQGRKRQAANRKAA